MEKKEKTIYEKLLAVQNELKAPKDKRNNFGGYNYRSCEGILEAVKPLLQEQELMLTIKDEVVNIGDRYYVRATVLLDDISSNGEIAITALAREEEAKKGMDASQITGTASSYARKYALNGLFLIDDTKDADTDEFHRTTQENGQKTNVATQPNQPPAKKIALTQKIVDEKLKFILEQTDTETVKNIWLNLSKMYEINKDTALGGILFKATENKVLELTKNKENEKNTDTIASRKN